MHPFDDEEGDTASEHSMECKPSPPPAQQWAISEQRLSEPAISRSLFLQCLARDHRHIGPTPLRTVIPLGCRPSRGAPVASSPSTYAHVINVREGGDRSNHCTDPAGVLFSTPAVPLVGEISPPVESVCAANLQVVRSPEWKTHKKQK